MQSQLNADQQKLADAMVRYWTEFAESGDPNSDGTPHWRRYHRHLDNIQSLAPGRHETGPEFDFAADHKCSFWGGLAGRVLSTHEDHVED
ncbi:MAG TPA: carboxylesterase family protein [Stellaceae bacterium]